jgi:phosphoribosylformylglycinamidine synthase
LPGNADLKQEVSLIINDSGKFEDRWVYLKSRGSAAGGPAYGGHKVRKSHGKCVWATNLPEIIYLPVAHGEGKFVAQDKKVIERLKRNHQVVFQYCDKDGRFSDYPDNPNGSKEDIAGICDETGRILGLMPHPERHIQLYQHPRWMGLKRKEGDGLQIFKNGVQYARKNL